MKRCDYCGKYLNGATVTVAGTNNGAEVAPRFYHFECYAEANGYEYFVEYRDDEWDDYDADL
jgi:hypothetical protein